MTRAIALLVLVAATPASGAQARSLPHGVLQTILRPSELQFARETLELTTPGGVTLVARILAPVRLATSTQRLPALLLFGGFEEAERVLDLVRPKVPIVIASFDYPFIPPRKFEFPASIRHAPLVKKAVRDTVAGIEELHHRLKQRLDVDPDRITVVGASFGAPFALAAAANDPRLTGLVIVHGFSDVPRTVTRQLLRRWEPKFGIFARPMAWLLAHAGWLYLEAPAPEDSARQLAARQRVLMISAQNDSFIPAESTEGLWNALRQSGARHRRVSMPGDHLQPGSDRLIDEIVALVTSWLDDERLR